MRSFPLLLSYAIIVPLGIALLVFSGAALPVALILLILIGVLVWYGDSTLRQQQQALESQNSLLMLQLINRADLSYMTLHALQRAFMKLEPTPDVKIAKAYHEIEEIAENLGLVRQLETGQLIPDKKPFMIDDLLRERIQVFREAEAVTGAKSGLAVIADHTMMAHVIDVLLQNIQQYNQRRSKITLTASQEEAMIRVTAAIVADQEARVPSSITQQIDLTVARLMAEKHGGELAFDFGGEEGINFHLLLPAG